MTPDTCHPVDFNHLKKTLDRCSMFPKLNENHKHILKLIQQLVQGYEDADRPLRILLAGGTGVGKSTLLNALAGKNIAQTGHKRPTTSGFTVYIHRDDNDPWLNSLNDISMQKHTHADLQRKVIIDAPDADSSILKNRKTLKKALILSDLVIVVVTAEKYVSRAVLKLLKQYQRGRQFVFVLNKMENGKSSDIEKDIVRVASNAGFPNVHVFSISTRNVILNRNNPSRNLFIGDFTGLQRFVGEELTHLHIREIHRLNLKERSAILADNIESSLPDNYSDTADKWLDHCEFEMRHYLNKLNSTLDTMFLSSEEFTSALTAQYTGQLKGPFGLFAGLLCTLQQIAQRKILSDRTIDIRSFIDRQLTTRDLQQLNQGMNRLKATCVSEGKRLGISEEKLNNAMNVTNQMDDVSTWLKTQMEYLISSLLRNKSRPPGRIVSGLLNLPALSWIGYWIYRLIEPVFQSESIPFEAIPGAFLILLMILGLQWYLIDHILKGIFHFKIKKMISDAQARLTHYFRAAFTPSIEKTARDISQITHDLELAIEQLLS